MAIFHVASESMWPGGACQVRRSGTNSIASTRMDRGLGSSHGWPAMDSMDPWLEVYSSETHRKMEVLMGKPIGKPIGKWMLTLW